MAWIKWVGGGIAALAVAGAILFGVVATGGGASAQEGEEGDDPGFDKPLGGSVGFVLTAGGPGEEYLQLVASKLGVTVEELQTAMAEAREELGLPEPGERRSGPFHRGAIFGFHLRGLVGLVAEITDTTAQEVIEAHRGGQSLADYASEHGVTLTQLKNAVLEQAGERLDQAIENDRIDEARKTEVLANLEERLDELLSKVPDAVAP